MAKNKQSKNDNDNAIDFLKIISAEFERDERLHRVNRRNTGQFET